MLIYLARSRTSSKCYIGMTSRTLAVRQKEHAWDASRGAMTAFHAAIRKYGYSDFDWSVIGESPDKASLAQLEIRLIAEYKPEYNLAPGGAGTGSSKGRVVSAETRRKLSEWAKSRGPRTPEHCQAISRGLTGLKKKPSTVIKAPITEETRAKLRAAQRARAAEIGDFHRGKPKSAEMKAKLSASRKRLFEERRNVRSR